MKKFLIVMICLAVFAIPFNAQAQTREGEAFIYQAWTSGGTIAWTNTPGATHYECTLYIVNLDTGNHHWVSTSNYSWVNPNDQLYYFPFDFSGGYWEIVGGNDKVDTSACNAWTSQWGISAVFKQSVFLDFREKIYLPIVTR